MSKLWEQSAGLNPLVEAYTVGDDYLYDNKLLLYDLEASLAHAKMLKKMGLLSETEYKNLAKGLTEIKKLYEDGKFKVEPSQEDCHTAIEQYLTENYGQAGKKIHTARSRNDQAMTMIRLYVKKNLMETSSLIEIVGKKFKDKSKIAKDIPMPGYTHMQKAMPTSVSEWLDAYQDAFNDLLIMVNAASVLIDQNPLGSAAGFGIKNLKIDKKITTKELDFAKVQENPLYAGISRGMFELIVLQQLAAVSTLAGKFAADMMLFTTQEFDYFSLPKEYTTGSSIMPNKHNYDLFEIMRANSGLVGGYHNQAQMILAGLGSGFNRDYQLIKPPLVKSFEVTISTLELLAEIIPKIKLNESKLKDAMTADLFATEKVYELVAAGMSFRDAYRQVKAQLESKG